jgi:hypothetical protein
MGRGRIPKTLATRTDIQTVFADKTAFPQSESERTNYRLRVHATLCSELHAARETCLTGLEAIEEWYDKMTAIFDRLTELRRNNEHFPGMRPFIFD